MCSVEVDSKATPLYTSLSPIFVVTPRISNANIDGDVTVTGQMSLSQSGSLHGKGEPLPTEIRNSVRSLRKLMDLQVENPVVCAFGDRYFAESFVFSFVSHAAVNGLPLFTYMSGVFPR